MPASEASTELPSPSIDGALACRVLGPLEVWRDGSLLPLGGPQERALLALLLTAPGRVFSVPTIVAGLWGENHPQGAEKTVQSYVSRLRRRLPADVATMVQTRRPGYLVALEPERVDAEMFRSLVATGRRELSTGNPEAAATTLREALGLWRGDAYAEFRRPFADAERAVLEELRLAALEDRISADLGVGAGPELVGELEQLVGAHPLREHLWSELMTALYRAGRQGDALRAYQRARSALVDELGVEPGSELQLVQAAVLAHDVRLLGSGAGAEGPVPAMLVRGPPIVGRDAELTWLRDAYRRATDGAVVRVLVTGPHGMGKTRVLAELVGLVQAGGGAVTDHLPQTLPSPLGAPALLVLDDLQRLSPEHLARLSQTVKAAEPPLLVAGACVLEELSDEQAALVESLFPERLALPPLLAAEVEALTRLYVPPEALAEALESVDRAGAGSVPLHVHAAASRYGEALIAGRIDTAFAAIPRPRHRLEESRELVAEGVTELQRLRALRDGYASQKEQQRVCPFKGLTFYDVDDAPYFAGRERLVAQLLARVVDSPLLAVVGASGSGKSSVVRAGLLAAVTQGLLPGSERWHTLVTTPTRRQPDLPAVDLSPLARTILVVDQFEELFTVLPQPSQRDYAAWLTATAERPDVTVVVALRSDYYGRVTAYPRLSELVAANTVLVGEMTPAELRQAVELPAAAAGLGLEPGLAETIAGDVAGQPGGLPLMSTALLSLWERGGGRSLSLADYREIGGVRTAVARLAEAAYGQLTPEQRARARRILLRLAEVDEAGEPVRRRAELTELAPEGDADARTALETLVSRRLLTVSAEHAEVAHEALLREWPRLRAWLDDDEAGRRLRRHLVPAAAAWQSTTPDAGELYRGARLTAALDWLRDHPDDLTKPERDFLDASREAAEADLVRRRRSLRRLRGLAAGLVGVLVLALGAGWVALDRRKDAIQLARQADVRALQADALGQDRLDRALLYAAQAFRLDGSTRSGAALLQIVQRSPEAAAVLATDQRLLGLALSADGRTLAALGSAGTAYVWDTASGRRVATVSGLSLVQVSSLDLSPDGRHLAVVGIPVVNGSFVGQRLLQADLSQTSARFRIVNGPEVSGARFTSDGRALVTLGLDGLARVVAISSGVELRRFAVKLPGSDTAVLDGPANRRYLAATHTQAAGPVTVWDVDTGRVMWSSRETDGTVASISPDGSAVVLGHADGRVEHIGLGPDGARRPVPSGLVDGLVDIEWSPGGATFAGATAEGTVAVWDAATLKTREILRGHSGTVSQVAYAPDGKSLYATGFDHTVIAWDLTGRRGIAHVVGQPLPADNVRHGLAANGSLAVTWLDRQSVRLLRVPGGASSTVRVPTGGNPFELAVDPSGSHVGLITDSGDGLAAVRVIDVASRRVLPYTIGRIPMGFGFDASFTADGRSLLIVGDRKVSMWDVRTGRPVPGIAGYKAQEDVASLTSDANGRTVALSETGGVVEVADLSSGRRVAQLDPHPGDGDALPVTPLVFSPDGRWLAGGSDNGHVVLWDTRTWKVHTEWLAVQGGGVDSLAFTPDSRNVVSGGAGSASVRDIAQGAAGGANLNVDPLRTRAPVSVGVRDGGRTVVTLTQDRGVMVWSVSPQRLLEHACQVAGRNLTLEEWTAALPNLSYERTCPSR